MQTDLKVIIGSKLHGLATPESDTDYRGVFRHSLIDIIDPWVKAPDIHWLEGGTTDDTATELRHFCFEAVKGSPSALETLFSDMVVETTWVGKVLQRNAHRFINSQRVFEAHKGYAHNQYAKMNLFEPDKRTPKFAVAYARSLVQGITLINQGKIINPIPEEWPGFTGLKDFLFEIKTCPVQDFGRVRGELSKLFSLLQQQLVDAVGKCPDLEADTKWIRIFLRHAYQVSS